MPTEPLARSPNAPPAGGRGRLQSLLLGGVWLVCYVLAAGYHLLLYSTGTPASATVSVVYEFVVITGNVALWMLLAHAFRRRRTAPARVFWTTLLLGVLYVLVGYLVSFVPPVDRPGYLDGIPLTLFDIFKAGVLALLRAVFAFVVLLRFRELVLIKRTRSSERNWYLMLGLMGLAALTGLGKPADEELSLLQVMTIIPAVVFMVVNSFRLSWIVSLSFREKMASSGLALLLLIVLMGTAGINDAQVEYIPLSIAYLLEYSYPLAIFTGLAVLFAILYCITAFLSLLFHLPTTSDFQRKAGEMATMHSLTSLVSQVFDQENLYRTIVAAPGDACSADAAWLAVPDLDRGSLRPRLVAFHHIDAQRVAAHVDVAALYDDVAARREPLLLPQAVADHRVTARPGDGFGSLLVTPLLARDEVLGVLFATKTFTHGFEPDEVEAIRIFVAQAALALDNARLFEEQLERERLSRELAIAREVQRRLLPQRLPALPGVTLAASSVSALEVGGDYYDFVRLDDHRLAVIVGDVSGKGTSAAFYMAEMQGVFQAVSRLAPAPADFLHHANAVLGNLLDKNVFISVVYGVLDLEAETFVLARAGHCPAAMISLTGEARYLRSRGLGLGLDRGGLFRRTLAEERIALQPGDVFVLYTDGIVESRNAAGEEYGYERLLQVLADHRHEDAADLHNLLLEDLNRFMGDACDYDDDMTLVVLKWHGIDLGAAAGSPAVARLPEPSFEHRPPPG